MIRTGIGGWTYPGWRDGVFYPRGLRQRDELAFAARAVGAIEINATYHRLQQAESFRGWAAAAPADFVFALKGSRFVTNRRQLAEAGEALGRFLGQGLSELAGCLGPIVWQLMAAKPFDPEDIASFIALLPAHHQGVALRHVIEVGHPSFACAGFVALARKAKVAICFSDAAGRQTIADRTAGFAYARLQGMRAEVPTGYSPAELARFASLARSWAAGEAPPGVPYAGDPAASAGPQRDVFVFMINGAKERAPGAAVALARLLADQGASPSSDTVHSSRRPS